METIKHFSHEHTLELQKHQIETFQFCYGCQKDIEGAIYYSCNSCKFFLHKECANLPLKFNHPNIHSEHPLILHANPTYSCKCVFCLKPCGGFTYHCSSCEFGLCVECTFLGLENRKVKLECHPQHPLTVMQKPAKFHCDACDEDAKDKVSYACDICPFWIHQRCLNLPSTRPQSEHPHELSLAYHVPQTVFRYRLKCDICRENFKLLNWLYYCGPCKYFVHVICKENSLFQRRREPLEGREDHIGHIWGALIFSMLVKSCSYLVKPFINGMSSCVQGVESMMKHFSHDHPLVLSSKAIENDNGEEILYDACIEPIFGQSCYYTCEIEGCSYLLHTACAYLPPRIEYGTYDQLTLKNFRKELGYFYCTCCQMTSNGFFFESYRGRTKLDLHCAIFRGNIIAHRGHNRNHYLSCKVIRNKFCEACGKNIDGMGYYCSYCPHFCYLHYQCVILPLEVRHRWDKHKLLLQFQPDHHHDEDEFYCEVCEEEIHPKHWHYYCQECDQSFHPFCIPRIGKDRFMKFGSTIKISHIHEHLLTSVRECGYESSCHSCGVKLYGQKGFECEPCTFFLCYGCACQVPPKPLQSPSYLD